MHLARDVYTDFSISRKILRAFSSEEDPKEAWAGEDLNLLANGLRGARIYFRARARRELAQPSLVTWCERATARESEGTLWVIQEPAPM